MPELPAAPLLPPLAPDWPLLPVSSGAGLLVQAVAARQLNAPKLSRRRGMLISGEKVRIRSSYLRFLWRCSIPDGQVSSFSFGDRVSAAHGCSTS